MPALEIPDELTTVEASPAEDPIFFWVHGEHRRIVVADYGDLKTLGKRVFERFKGGRGRWLDLQGHLYKLLDPGRPAAAVFGRHVIGFVRPWVVDGQELDPGRAPAMIARASRRGFYLINPVLVPELEDGRALLRRLRSENGISPRDWQCYFSEYPPDPMEKLFMPGSPGLRTSLEHELTASFGPKGRARQHFTRPDAEVAA